jgi:hypothetical protein
VKLETEHKPFDLYRPATGLGRVAENTNICQGKTAKLQKRFINVAELLQDTEFLFCFSFVSLV